MENFSICVEFSMVGVIKIFDLTFCNRNTVCPLLLSSYGSRPNIVSGITIQCICSAFLTIIMLKSNFRELNSARFL
jgi:hypothetical protein